MRRLIVIALFFLAGCNLANNLATYDAGFKIVKTVDKSRKYKPNTDTTNYLHYRPVDIDIWYPATSSSSDSQLLVRDLIGLLESRANYYSASEVGTGITHQLAQFFSETFNCSDTTRLLNFQSKSHKNAQPIKSKFPLVIYMTAYNGMSYENFVLFEELAKKGFVVVSISSIGRFPGDMSTKEDDLMEQVNDAQLAIDLLKEDPNIDFEMIGIVGYSWGGLGGVLLANKLQNVKCLVSLDGSEKHHYGYGRDEDVNFDSLRNGNTFKSIRLSMPYFRLESSPASQDKKEDSLYDFATNHVRNPQIYAIDSVQHVDFDCFSLIARQAGMCTINQRYNTALRLTVSFLETNLKNKETFSKTLSEELNRTIRKK